MRLTAHRLLALAAACVPLLAAAQAGSTLDKVKSSGTITVAYRESSIPFSYLDDKAQPTGFGWAAPT
jgi:ABC-type amino acid transport substrate-binding protein